MPDKSYHLNLIIDSLTNSIFNVNKGISRDTEISFATKVDIQLATRKNKWHFAWGNEFRQEDRNVFKLTCIDEPAILQGLISLSDMTDHVYIHLAESAPQNFGIKKLHEGVGGNLFAYACKRSWDNGNEGIISFQSKTKLLKHYHEVLGAIHIGQNRMIIYPDTALILIKQYFSN